MFVIELMWTVRSISLHKKYQLGDLNEVENKKDEKIKETWVWKNWKGLFFCGKFFVLVPSVYFLV